MAAQRVKVIDRQDIFKLSEIDSSVKNKFKWDWLERQVEIKDENFQCSVYLVQCFRKVDIAGKAECIVCCDFINYGSRGSIALVDHVKSVKHVKKEKLLRSNYAFDNFIDVYRAYYLTVVVGLA
jgi:hypothetical protein